MAKADWAPLADRVSDEERDARILEHLNEAHIHLGAAEDLIYGAGHQYRDVRYRRVLFHVKDRCLKLGLRERNLQKKGKTTS